MATPKKIFVPNFMDGPGAVEFGDALRRDERFILDFSRIGFAQPGGMVLLSHFISQAVISGKIVDVDGCIPKSYPANMGFFEVCGIDVPKAHATGGENYQPVTKIDLNRLRAKAQQLKIPVGQHVDVTVGRMAYLITRVARGPLFDLVKYCLREIVRNAAEHSQGTELVLCGQYWPTKNEVEISLLDNGIGIRAGLAKNAKFANVSSDRDALRLAILPSVSGSKVYKTDDDLTTANGDNPWDNSGFGLYITSQLARASGHFLLGSGEAYQLLSGSSKKDGRLDISGTYAVLGFNVGELKKTSAQINLIARKGERFAQRHLTSGVGVMASAASKFLIE